MAFLAPLAEAVGPELAAGGAAEAGGGAAAAEGGASGGGLLSKMKNMVPGFGSSGAPQGGGAPAASPSLSADQFSRGVTGPV